MTTQQQRKARARARHDAYVQRQQTKSAQRRRRNVVFASVAGAILVIGAGSALWWATKDDSVDTQALPDDYTYTKAEQVLPKGSPADLVLDTDHGPITVALDTTKATENANSLAFLAGQGYFDNTPCHRLTTEGIFVLQCGDRSGTGSGGPGYTTADENLPKDVENNYPAGTVAMAEPSGGEAGSQFFLVYDDTTLPPDYTIVGQITEGLDVVQGVAAAGVSPDSPQPGDGAPADPITITAARIEQSK